LVVFEGRSCRLVKVYIYQINEGFKQAMDAIYDQMTIDSGAGEAGRSPTNLVGS